MQTFENLLVCKTFIEMWTVIVCCSTVKSRITDWSAQDQRDDRYHAGCLCRASASYSSSEAWGRGSPRSARRPPVSARARLSLLDESDSPPPSCRSPYDCASVSAAAANVNWRHYVVLCMTISLLPNLCTAPSGTPPCRRRQLLHWLHKPRPDRWLVAAIFIDSLCPFRCSFGCVLLSNQLYLTTMYRSTIPLRFIWSICSGN